MIALNMDKSDILSVNILAGEVEDIIDYRKLMENQEDFRMLRNFSKGIEKYIFFDSKSELLAESFYARIAKVQNTGLVVVSKSKRKNMEFISRYIDNTGIELDSLTNPSKAIMEFAVNIATELYPKFISPGEKSFDYIYEVSRE